MNFSAHPRQVTVTWKVQKVLSESDHNTPVSRKFLCGDVNDLGHGANRDRLMFHSPINNLRSGEIIDYLI